MKQTNKKKAIHLIVDFIAVCVLILFDQYTKNLAIINLKDRPAIAVIPNVFELNYLENRGAAFGMLQNQKAFFVCMAVIMLAVIFYVLVRLPLLKKFCALETIFVLIASGAIGNMIDRIKMNYVVDFFYFKLINFPIFNVADIYVSVSCVVLALLLMFYYKEADFEFLSRKKNKEHAQKE